MNTGKETIRVDPNLRKELAQAFLAKNSQQIVKGISFDKLEATIVPDTDDYLSLLGEMIRNGQLVAFPTETVYGLGADATNQHALLQIYRVKRRPLTDPIIVHVLDSESALKLVLIKSESQRQLFLKLTEKYWPGPLTIILQADLQILPKVVTAQTGFVGLRSPKCEYARKLIKESNRPIGAPSANLFSHVSPTSPCHVLNDFYDQNITIVNGQKCEYGIESTVVKIVDGNLQVLRQGSLSTEKLSEFVKTCSSNQITVRVKRNTKDVKQNQNMEAPGQLLKHYAPYLPCYYIDDVAAIAKHEKMNNYISQKQTQLLRVALIAFDQEFEPMKQKVKYYLSTNENAGELEDEIFCTREEKKKMKDLYSNLRTAQNLDVEAILIGWSEEKSGTIWDKIFRATQGQKAEMI